MGLFCQKVLAPLHQSPPLPEITSRENEGGTSASQLCLGLPLLSLGTVGLSPQFPQLLEGKAALSTCVYPSWSLLEQSIRGDLPVWPPLLGKGLLTALGALIMNPVRT